MTSRFLTFLAIGILFSSCSGVKVITDKERGTDYSGYETYQFLGWQDADDDIFTRADLELIKSSLIEEIEKRGLKRGNAHSDLKITCYFVTSTESAFSGYNDYVGGKGSGFNHYSGGWGYGYSGNTAKQRSQLVGTLIMNVYEGNSKNQIWQAVATGNVNDNPRKDRTKTIPRTVASLMRWFPFKNP